MNLYIKIIIESFKESPLLAFLAIFCFVMAILSFYHQVILGEPVVGMR